MVGQYPSALRSTQSHPQFQSSATHTNIGLTEPSEALSSSRGGSTTTATKTRKRTKRTQAEDSVEPMQKRVAMTPQFEQQGGDAYSVNTNTSRLQQQILMQQQRDREELVLKYKLQQTALAKSAQEKAEEEYKEFVNGLDSEQKEIQPVKCDARHSENVWTVIELRNDIDTLKKCNAKVASAVLALRNNAPGAALGAKECLNELERTKKPTENIKAAQNSEFWVEKCFTPHRTQRTVKVKATELAQQIAQVKMSEITKSVKSADECDVVMKRLLAEQQQKQLLLQQQQQQQQQQILKQQQQIQQIQAYTVQQQQQVESQWASSSRGSHTSSETKPRSKHKSQHSGSLSGSGRAAQKGQPGEVSKRHQRHEDHKSTGAYMGDRHGQGVIRLPNSGSGPVGGVQGANIMFANQAQLQSLGPSGQGCVQQQIIVSKFGHKKIQHQQDSQHMQVKIQQLQPPPPPPPQSLPQQPQQTLCMPNDLQVQDSFAVTPGRECVHQEHQLFLHKQMEHRHNMSASTGNGGIGGGVGNVGTAAAQKRGLQPQPQLQQKVTGTNLQYYSKLQHSNVAPPPPQLQQLLQKPKIEGNTHIPAYTPVLQTGMIIGKPAVVNSAQTKRATTPTAQTVKKK